MNALRIIRVSRPHLWIYTAGSFFLGSLSAGNQFSLPFVTTTTTVIFLWLTLPANLALYALNDAYDAHADALNSRKKGVERPLDSKLVYQAKIISLCAASSVLVILPVLSSKMIGVLLVCAVFVITYNMPPFRFKSRPILDCLLALVYPACGLLGYLSVSGVFPTTSMLGALCLFGIGMHIYSAAIDRSVDIQAGSRTVASLFPSSNAAIIGAAVVFAFCAALVALGSGIVFACIPALYVAWCLIHLYIVGRGSIDDSGMYAKFAVLHGIAGTILTVSILQ